MDGQIGLTEVTNGAVQWLLHVSKTNDWDEIATDAREELVRRAGNGP